MTTVYEQAAIEYVNEHMRDATYAQTVCQYLDHLHSGEYPDAYVDTIFQKWRYKPDIYDAASFSQVHTAIRAGRVAVFQVEVGDTPCADRLVDEMNRRLSGLTHPFSAEFWGGTADTDGYFRWERPVNALIQRPETGEVLFVIVPPGEARLEVGYNASHKMVYNVNIGVANARWPYGQNRITVLVPRSGCKGEADPDFGLFLNDVHGDFFTLPNPYDDWWKKTP